MKYETYITRHQKQFTQLTVEAPNVEEAKRLALLQAQEVDESEWSPEAESGLTVERVAAAIRSA